MQFGISIAFSQTPDYVPIAVAAEENGFSTITLPDHLIYPRELSVPYPYTPDGVPRFTPDDPFPDPWLASVAMAAATKRLWFYTSIYVLPARNPFHVAKIMGSAAEFTGNRVRLGIGMGWMPEEFAAGGQEFARRGARADEMIEILQLICGGGGAQFHEYHGRFYDFDRLMISPAPERAVPIYVGGLSDPGFRRAARLADGWISVQNSEAEITHALGELARYRAEYGRDHLPFEVNALCIDVFDLDGYKRLEDKGVTELQTVPWYFYGGDPNDLSVKLDSLARFADEVITKL